MTFWGPNGLFLRLGSEQLSFSMIPSSLFNLTWVIFDFLEPNWAIFGVIFFYFFGALMGYFWGQGKVQELFWGLLM